MVLLNAEGVGVCDIPLSAVTSAVPSTPPSFWNSKPADMGYYYYVWEYLLLPRSTLQRNCYERLGRHCRSVIRRLRVGKDNKKMFTTRRIVTALIMWSGAFQQCHSRPAQLITYAQLLERADAVVIGYAEESTNEGIDSDYKRVRQNCDNYCSECDSEGRPQPFKVALRSFEAAKGCT